MFQRQFQMDVAALKLAQSRKQPERGHRWRHRQADDGAALRPRAGHRRPALAIVGQHRERFLGAGEETHALRREGDAACLPLEQAYAHPAFQPRDLARYGAMRQPALLGSSRERAESSRMGESLKRIEWWKSGRAVNHTHI